MARTAAIAPVCSHFSKDAREIKCGIPVENEQGYQSDGNREGGKISIKGLEGKEERREGRGKKGKENHRN